MLLLRLCPLIPFNGLNYCCGITGVSLHDFVLSMVGVLPFQLFTVIVGATTTSLAISTNQIHENPGQELAWIILICSGIGFGIVALIYTWKLVKKELRKVRNEIGSEQFADLIVLSFSSLSYSTRVHPGTRNYLGTIGFLFAPTS